MGFEVDETQIHRLNAEGYAFSVHFHAVVNALDFAFFDEANESDLFDTVVRHENSEQVDCEISCACAQGCDGE